MHRETRRRWIAVRGGVNRSTDARAIPPVVLATLPPQLTEDAETGRLVDEAVAVLASVGRGPGVSDEEAGRQTADFDRATQTALARRAGVAGMRHKLRLLEAYDGALKCEGEALFDVIKADLDALLAPG